MLCSPIYDEYADEVDQISISNDVDLISSQPIYDSYGSDFEEPLSLPIKEQHQVEDNYPVFVDDIEHDEFDLARDFRNSKKLFMSRFIYQKSKKVLNCKKR